MSICSARREPLLAALSPGTWLLLCAILVACVSGTLMFMPVAALVDEPIHFGQVMTFRTGAWEHHPKLTNIPGYHAVMSAASWLTGTDSLNALRLQSLAIGLLGLPIVFMLVRRLDAPWATTVTAQFLFFPLLLPYQFLIYTDPLGLECILLSLALSLDGCLWGAALVSAFGVMVRQTQITWMLFVFVLPYVRQHGVRLERAAILDHLRRGWLFLVGFAAFGVFLVVNHGVALGDRSAHPDTSFYWGNIFFALFLCALIFLPLHVANLPRIAALIRARPWWLLIVAAALGVYWFGCRFDHPYNEDRWYLRNRILRATMVQVWWKAVFFVPVALSILSLAVTELKEKSFSLLYPFAVLNMAPSWLVEPRYAMPSLVLFLLLRVRRSWLVEGTCLAWSILLSLLLLIAMSTGWSYL